MHIKDNKNWLVNLKKIVLIGVSWPLSPAVKYDGIIGPTEEESWSAFI
jgi:hypothetical protein